VWRIYLGVIVAALCALSFFAGLYQGAFRTGVYFTFDPLYRKATGRPQKYDSLGRFVDVSDRQKVPCPAQTERTFVVIAFGQSNAANSLEHRYKAASSSVVNFYAGACYSARDPLLGSTKQYGSVWTLLGNRVIAAGLADRVIIVASGVSGASVERWASGDLRELLADTLEDVRASGYSATHFLWHQGETDAVYRTTAEHYSSALKSIIQDTRRHSPRSKFFVSSATVCNSAPNDEVRRGQDALVDPDKAILKGPDTDPISERFDGCHFSTEGQEKVVALWLEAMAH
jgi:hypothetical protein